MLAACRCCASLARPVRLRKAHVATREFGSSVIAANKKPDLPKTDWSAFKTGSGGGGLPGLSKWAKPADSAPPRRSFERGDRQRGSKYAPNPGFGFEREGEETRSSSQRDGPRRSWGERGAGVPGREPARDRPSRPAEDPRPRSGLTGRPERPSRPRDNATPRSRPQPSAKPVANKVAQPADEPDGVDGDDDADAGWDDSSEDSSQAGRSRRRRRKDGTEVSPFRDGEFVRERPRKTSTFEDRGGQDEETRRQRELRQREKQRRLLQREERKVFIPTSVTVARLASIFGVKQCQSTCLR